MDEPPISEYTLLPIEIGEELAVTLLPIYTPRFEGFTTLTLLPAKSNFALFSLVASLFSILLSFPTMVTVLPVFALLFRPNIFTAELSSFAASVPALLSTPTMIGNVSLLLSTDPVRVFSTPHTNCLHLSPLEYIGPYFCSAKALLDSINIDNASRVNAKDGLPWVEVTPPRRNTVICCGGCFSLGSR
ncbi:hypothetical protein MZB18_05910 [Haemophilus influenzae]